MVVDAKSICALVLRLIVGLALLGCPSVGSAQGTWSVISLQQKPGEVLSPRSVAVDTADNLYVAEEYDHSQIQKRDAQGHWSVLATFGEAPGQVWGPSALAVDDHASRGAPGSLYVADGSYPNARIQKRDAQGTWSVTATAGAALGQVGSVTGLAVDADGSLYVADAGNARIQKRDAQGHWSLIASGVHALAMAADAEGILYVADANQVRKRDPQGNCYENNLLGRVQAGRSPAASPLAEATGRGSVPSTVGRSLGAQAASGCSIVTLQPSFSSRCTNFRCSTPRFRSSKYPAPNSS